MRIPRKRLILINSHVPPYIVVLYRITPQREVTLYMIGHCAKWHTTNYLEIVDFMLASTQIVQIEHPMTNVIHNLTICTTDAYVTNSNAVVQYHK